jgi:hypothetical protein
VAASVTPSLDRVGDSSRLPADENHQFLSRTDVVERQRSIDSYSSISVMLVVYVFTFISPQYDEPMTAPPVNGVRGLGALAEDKE